MMIKVNRAIRNQKGFTLIEIIAVLVILGILAAIAIPKYFSLMDDAKSKAAQGAVAQGIANVNQYAAKYLLSNSITPTPANVVAALSTVTGGDFTINYTASGTTAVVVSAQGTSPNINGTAATATGSAVLPQ